MPFADFTDFDDCVSKNQDKGDAKAYCAAIMRKAEGEKIMRNTKWIAEIFPVKEAKQTDNFLEIEGVAINETTTRNNYIYTAEELDKAAPTLINRPILKDHTNSVDSIVGIVTSSIFDKDKRNIQYRGKIMDKETMEKINDGRVSAVSIGANVADLIEEENDKGKFKVKGLEFLELSLVAIPGDPNASVGASFERLAESFKLHNSYHPSITTAGTSSMGTVGFTNSAYTGETFVINTASTANKNIEEKTMEDKIQKLEEENKKLKEELNTQLQERVQKLEAQIIKLSEAQEVKGRVVIENPVEEVYQDSSRFTVVKDSKGLFVLERGREGSSFFRIKSPEDLRGLN